MRLVLVNDGDIILTDIHETLSVKHNTIEVNTKFVKDLHLYKMHSSLNGGSWEPIEDNKVVIPESLFTALGVIIRVRLEKLTDRSRIIYTTDNIPINHYISFGPKVEDVYPRVISDLKKRVDILEKDVRIIKNKGDIF